MERLSPLSNNNNLNNYSDYPDGPYNINTNDENEPPYYSGLDYGSPVKPSETKLKQLYPGYDLIKVIGSGFFGKVYEATRLSDNKSIALKVVRIDPNNPDSLEDLKREVTILSKISDPVCQPYLVCFLGYKYLEDQNVFLIEMNMVQGNTLSSFSNTYRGTQKFTKYLLLIMKDIIKAIQYLHQNNIIHNDIKPDNIIIDANLTPVLVDMGVACLDSNVCALDTPQGSDKTKKCCLGVKGPNMYLSPETIATKGAYFKESDVWGLGLTFYVIVNREFPFDIGPIASAKRMINAIRTEEPKKLRSGNEVLDHIVNRALDKNINTRITLAEISDILTDI